MGNGDGNENRRVRHRGWADPQRLEATLGWYEDAGVAWVAVDAPPGGQITIMQPVDAVTHPRLAYLRAHGLPALECAS